ncbi:hypothetical protein AAF712_002880 [Marasmius tenuissimus]|uniref:Uncharacterized protein n=1 Tax=Marasmius tenuissimus TaxID=585030 RepID=A0ABR3A8R0_9AGAR|nr:hypothetical protein PM082_000466 [Marasmius tenuissimus]
MIPERQSFPSPPTAAVETVEDGVTKLRNMDDVEKKVAKMERKLAEMEEAESPHTLFLDMPSELPSRYQRIIKRVAKNGRSDLESGYLDILCDASNRFWAQIISRKCAKFIRNLQGTSVVPTLVYEHPKLVAGHRVVVVEFPGDPMSGIPHYPNKRTLLALASRLLEHMVTLVEKDILRIHLEPDDVFFDLTSTEVKHFNHARVSTGKSKDRDIVQVARRLFASLSDRAGSAGPVLKKLSDKLLRSTLASQRSAMSGSMKSDALTALKDAVEFIRTCQ